MSIEIIPINGKANFFDYEAFEESAKAIFGRSCSDAKIFLLNNFPASVSVETNIDLILIIAVEDKTGNFYRLDKKRAVYFHDQIIPIRVVNQFEDSEISTDDNGQLIADNEFIDYSLEINSIVTSGFMPCFFKISLVRLILASDVSPRSTFCKISNSLAIFL